MSDTGYAYIPKSCASQICRVHVAFHGCEQGATQIGNLFYSTTGYNELADSNNIIVLYPQVQASDLIPYNPKGCWDFWGYSSPNQFAPNFYSRQAPQMGAVKAMLDRLSQARQ
jgi:poly(3-hydroxybutyrate) depolymerase